MDQRMRKTLFGSAKSDWGTPQWFYEILNAEFSFGLDAAAQDSETDAEYALRQEVYRSDLEQRCARMLGPDWASDPECPRLIAQIVSEMPRRQANWKHPNFLSEVRSAFGADWVSASGGQAAFLNPPYGRVIGSWTALAKHWGQKMQVVCLVPARTDTRWFWETCLEGAKQIRLLRGRLRFDGATETAPFPSAVVVYGPTPPGFQSRRAEIVGWDPPRPQGVSVGDEE